MKLIKEAKRLQQLAGINEIKIQKPKAVLDSILEKYKDAQLEVFENSEDVEPEQINNFITNMTKDNIFSIEDLAKNIKNIHDYIATDLLFSSPEGYYGEGIIEPLIKVFNELNVDEHLIQNILNALDKLYGESNGYFYDMYKQYIDFY
jgi:hypothetical protein